MPQKKRAGENDRPARTLDELHVESRRLEQRGRELMEQVKALASDVADAKAKSQDGRSRRK